MSLEVATAAGSLAGGITAQLLSEDTVRRLFAAVMAVIAVLMLRTLNQKNTLRGSKPMSVTDSQNKSDSRRSLSFGVIISVLATSAITSIFGSHV